MRYADSAAVRAAIVQALAKDGRPVFVGASAGSGKTSTIVDLYAALIQEGVSASDIAAITFTENAAHEMKRRIRAKAGAAGTAGASISTIHSFCLMLIREYGCAAGIALPPRIAGNDHDADDLIRDAVCAELDRSTPSAQALMPIYQLHIAAKKSSFIDSVVALAEGIIPRFGDAKGFIASVEAVLDRAGAYEERRDIASACLSRMMAFTGKGKSLPEYKERIAPIAALSSFRTLGELSEDDFFRVHAALKFISDKIATGATKRIEKFTAFVDDLKRLADIADALILDIAFARYAHAVRGAASLAVTALNAYEAMRVERNIISFDDIIATAVRLFDDPAAADAMRRRFRCLIVDEFQDTNWQQYALIRRFVDGDGPKPVLFVVGDRKQSIYRFRNADVTLFSRTEKDIADAGGASFSLTNNFRSTPPMLAFFNAFFAHVFAGDSVVGYGADDDFSNASASDERPVTFLLLNTETADGSTILARERTALEAEAFARYVSQGPRDAVKHTALLLPSFSAVHAYLSAFAAHGIPYRIMGGQGFYEREEIRDMTILLSYLTSYSDELFFPAIRLPIFSLSSADASSLAVWMGEQNIEPHALIGNDSPVDAGDEALRAVSLMREFRNKVSLLRTAELIEYIIERSHYHAYLMAGIEGDIAFANVRKFIEIARAFEAGGARMTADFVRFIEHETDAAVKEGYAVIPELSSEALSVYTIHAAKGLEFETVLLGGLAKRPRTDTKDLSFIARSLAMRITHPDIGTLYLSGADEADEERAMLSERRRLLYVAATRAKRSLVIAGPLGDSGDAAYDSFFERFVAENGGMPVTAGKYGTSEAMKTLVPVDHAVPHARFIMYGRGIARDGGFEDRSAAAEEVCRTLAAKPRRKPIVPVRRYGTITARAHELFSRDSIDRITLYRGADDGNLTPAEMGDRVHRMLERFEIGSSVEDSIKAHFPNAGADAERARGMLNAFIASTVGSGLASGVWKLIGREVPFTAIKRSENNEVWLSGRIDLIASDDKGAIVIVDYKTAKEPPSSEAYRFQMRAYCTAVSRMYGKPLASVRALLLYLGTKKGAAEERIAVAEEEAAEIERMLYAAG